MLLGLDPVLSPDLLHALAAMGHGDRIVLVDANYPATRGRRLILLPAVDTPRALPAALSVLPIDMFVPEPCARTQLERIGAEASRRKVDTDLKFKSSEAQSFKPSGNGFVGGTGWITGYNVQSANPVVVG